MLAETFVFAWGMLLWEIPNDINVTSRQDICLGSKIPVSYERGSEEEVFASTGKEVYQVTCKFLGIIPIKQVTVHVTEDQEVIPGGLAAGLLLEMDGVYVADTDEVTSMDGKKEDPCGHILHTGDYILAVDGVPVSEKEDVIDAVDQSEGKDMILTIRRDGEQMDCRVSPVETQKGAYKLGIWVKDDLAGVGTITYIDGDGNYGALGHGISDSETDELIDIKEGRLYESEIVAVNRGEKGTPGELVGMIYFRNDNYMGTIDSNTNSGIFGTIAGISDSLSENSPMQVGHKQEVENGPASILSDVDGTIQSYEIEIEDVTMNGKDENKSMLIRVTDEALLKKTGGIVQGMSGSPIIQNGKLVGAVTHVLVNDPTRGYGILAEDMIKTAG